MTKSAGEHWVCAALARHRWAAALTRDGIERTDILAVHTGDGDRRMIEVQVKAHRGAGPGANWLIGTKAQQPAVSDREWFVLVLLDPDPLIPPRSFVLPRDHLAAVTWIGHRNWETDPTVPPGRRNTPISLARVDVGAVDGYEDRWDLLGTPTGRVPVLLPSRFRALALEPRVGLPPDHPWQRSLPDW